MKNIFRHGLFALISVSLTIFAAVLTVQMIMHRYIPINPIHLFSADFFWNTLTSTDPSVTFRLFWGSIIWGSIIFAFFFPAYRRLLFRLFKQFKELTELIVAFCKEYKMVVVAAIIIFVLCFGFEIANPTLSIDEEGAVIRTGRYGNITTFLIRGMLGIAILEGFFLFHGTLPFFVGSFIGAALWMVSALVWCVVLFFPNDSETKPKPLSLVVFVGLFMSMPSVVPEFMIFGIFNVFISLAMIFSAFSIYFIKQYNTTKNKVYFLTAILTLTFAISIYEAFISVFITGTVAALLHALLQTPRLSGNKNTEEAARDDNILTWLRKFPSYVIALIISVAGYFALLHITLMITGVQTSPYTSSFIGWGQGTPIITLFRLLTDNIYDRFLAPDFIGTLGIRLTIIALIALSILAIISYKGWKRLLIPVMCIFLGLSPFSLSLALMNPMSPVPLRAMQALPLMMGIAWGFLFLLLRQLTARRIAVFIPYMVALMLVFGQIQTLNRQFYGDHIRYRMDRQLAATIMYDVKNEFGEIPDTPMMFLGVHHHPLNHFGTQTEVVGGSFWSWGNWGTGNENHRRIINFLRSQGYDVIPVIGHSKREMEALYREQMPIWPQEGSIIVTEHGIMIRLS